MPRKKLLCRHCGPRTGNEEHRWGLCRVCYEDAEIKARYPRSSHKMGFARENKDDFEGEAHEDLKPANGAPKSAERKLSYEERREASIALFSTSDDDREIALANDLLKLSMPVRIRRLMIRAGLTYEQLAEKAGLPFSVVHYAAKGERRRGDSVEVGKGPTLQTLEKLAAGLGVSLALLLGIKEKTEDES